MRKVVPLMLMLFVLCNKAYAQGTSIKVPDSTKQMLMKAYPKAKNVRWTGAELPWMCHAWFNLDSSQVEVTVSKGKLIPEAAWRNYTHIPKAIKAKFDSIVPAFTKLVWTLYCNNADTFVEAHYCTSGLNDLSTIKFAWTSQTIRALCLWKPYAVVPQKLKDYLAQTYSYTKKRNEAIIYVKGIYEYRIYVKGRTVIFDTTGNLISDNKTIRYRR